MSKRKVKFTSDRGVFKKDQVIEVTEEIAIQLMSTGKEGSVVDAEEKDKVTSRNVINAQIKAAGKAKAKELKEKLKADEE